MDKSWIQSRNRNSEEYGRKVDEFLEFAYRDKPEDSRIYCPCRDCENRFFVSKSTARSHIIVKGFLSKYTVWVFHGENYNSAQGTSSDRASRSDGDNMVRMVEDIFGGNIGHDSGVQDESLGGMDETTKRYFKLLQEAQSPLFVGCTDHSELSFIVHLLHLKVLGGWTDGSFTLLLEFLNKVFPHAKIPSSYYEAKKIIENLGFSYETWDVCPKDCMIYRGKDSERNECEICSEPRYKAGGKKIAAKQMRYFPLKPRLQNLFRTSEVATLMKWHVEGRKDDGVLRHPADSQAWKSFDDKHPTFASDSRNIRLGLASDGFSPFSSMRISHSTWPVVLIPYNLPPWLCMKQSNFILSVLVDGPKSPGNRIDVYLQPLIEELVELWNEGVWTYDAASKSMFKMYATLLWTISDFPAYSNLSGWSTKGKYACPCCASNTRSLWLKNSRKFCYMGHRAALTLDHRFRQLKASFDGNKEFKTMPRRLSGAEVHAEVNGILTEYKKVDLKKRHNGEFQLPNGSNWKKKSIFFELPYWKDNLVRHNIDVMHTEKNFMENVLSTIFNIKNKSKDHMKARRDLKVMGIRKALHPTLLASGKENFLPANFTMSRNQRLVCCTVLKDTKLPDGIASNISKRVNVEERSIWGLKSHDHHMLMQLLIPLAVRKTLPPNIVKVLIELSNFFRQLCSKINRLSDLEYIQDRIALILCQLERIFPPSFFDIMEHLPIHLVEEAILAGSVLFRWMYPIERYLYTLKKYVRNQAHPEASIANGYLMEECMNFCTRYLEDAETKGQRPPRNYDGGNVEGRAPRKGVRVTLDRVTWTQCHRYILMNSDSIKPFINMHMAELSRNYPQYRLRQIEKLHYDTFLTWFKTHVAEQLNAGNCQYSNEIKSLARGPHMDGRSFKAYMINGFHFRTKSSESGRTTQNSGVLSRVNTTSVGETEFYGVLTDIIQIRYNSRMKFVLFKCDWVDNGKGKIEDAYKFTLVNFDHLLYKNNELSDEPFILANQAEQVFYSTDPTDTNWEVVLKMGRRDNYDVYSSLDQADLYSAQSLEENMPIRDEDGAWVSVGHVDDEDGLSDLGDGESAEEDDDTY